MSKQLTLELNDEVYNNLQQQAQAIGLSVTELVTYRLTQNPLSETNTSLTEAEREKARMNFRSHAGSISLGYPTDANNESIDTDLAKAYMKE